MLFRLTSEQEVSLLSEAARRTQAEIDAGCEPSGYLVEIFVAGPYGASATVVFGAYRLELGEIELTLST